MQNLIETFKKRLKNDGRNYKWFLSHYLPDTKYTNFTTQINKFSPLSDTIKKAIEKYLKEGD